MKIKNVCVSLAVIGLAAALMNDAQAAFVLVQEAAPAPAPVAAPAQPGVGSAPLANRREINLDHQLASRITQDGTAPYALPPIKGRGVSVTFVDALRQIIPPEWRVYSDADIPETLTVNWEGNRNWPQALNTALTAARMRANINWDRREVELRFDPVAAPVMVATAEVVTPLPPPPPPVKTLRLEVGKTLRENLRTWCTQEGWELRWNAFDEGGTVEYTIDAAREFNVPLIGQGGALDQVMADYGQAKDPLKAKVYASNHVVEIVLARPIGNPAPVQ